MYFSRIFIVFMLFVSGSVALGQERLFERTPFDRLVLDAANGNKSFDIVPIRFENGKKPVPLPKTGDLTIRFLDSPADEYSVPWSTIDRIDTFDEMVLRELNTKLQELTREIPNIEVDRVSVLRGRLDDLFDYYEYFFEKAGGETPEITASYHRYLFVESALFTKAKDWPNAIVRFERLYRINPGYPDLETRYSNVIENRIKEFFNAGKYADAKNTFLYFSRRYPANHVVREWRSRFQAQTEEYLEKSKKAQSEGDFWVAHENAKAALECSLEPDAIKEYANNLHRQSPRFVLGVRPDDNGYSGSWSDYRKERLLQRTLFEYAGPGLDSGEYVSPFGEYSKGNANRELFIGMQPDIRWNRLDDFISAFDVAETLMDLQEKRDGSFWNEFFESASIEDRLNLNIVLKKPHLLPESLLKVPVFPSKRFSLGDRTANDEAEPESVGNGPYIVRKSPEPGIAVFYKNENYSFPGTGGPKMIVERAFSDPEEAIDALLKGEIDALDQIAPWHVQELQRSGDIRLEAYEFKTLHFLVPNMKKTLSGKRAFRRGLLYGLDRQKILEQLHGNALKAEMISGPILKTSSLNDSLGYGYNNSVKPAVYEPKLGIVLTLLAIGSLQSENEEKGIDISEEIVPKLLIAHPPSEPARVACIMIQRQWKAIGIESELVPYPENGRIGEGTEIDFWYVEFPFREPISDVMRILSAEGLLGSSSPYMALALEKARSAVDWPQIAKELQAIHKLSAEEITVLPLWQWNDHFAIRRDITNLREPGRTGMDRIYQNIENLNVP